MFPHEPNGVGLAIMGCRPFTKGHGWIVDTMLERHGDGNVYLVLGSAGSPVSERCPWTVEQRMQMPRNVYGKRIKIIPMKDLGTTAGSNDWIDSVRAKIRGIGLLDPTDYYTGSRDDAEWYIRRFYHDEWSPKMDDATFRESFVMPDGRVRRLNVMDRQTLMIADQTVSGTGVRTMIAMGNPEWKKHVHEENWEFIESTFPEKYKTRY